MSTAPAYDFSGLTLSQKYLMSFAGWNPDTKREQPRRATVRKLIERGLVVERDVVFMGVRVKAYDVPIEVHMAWCEHCSAEHAGKAAA